MYQLFIGQGQPEYFRAQPHVHHCSDRGRWTPVRPVLVFDHPCDGLEPGNFGKQIVRDTGMGVVLRLLGWGELLTGIDGLDGFRGRVTQPSCDIMAATSCCHGLPSFIEATT